MTEEMVKEAMNEGGEVTEYLPPLESAEQERLTELEDIVGTGFKTFCEVGTALKEIRGGRLYRDEYDDWDSYCRGRWDMSRSYAHRIMDSSSVIQNLLPIGNIPKNEAQVRPLTKIEDPNKQREVWEKAVQTAQDIGQEVTAKLVDSIVRAECPPIPKPKSKPKSKPEKKPDGEIPDVMFWPEDTPIPDLPPAIRDPFQKILIELSRMQEGGVSLPKDERTYLRHQLYELKVFISMM
jgi:hypothetical protein